MLSGVAITISGCGGGSGGWRQRLAHPADADANPGDKAAVIGATTGTARVITTPQLTRAARLTFTLGRAGVPDARATAWTSSRRRGRLDPRRRARHEAVDERRRARPHRHLQLIRSADPVRARGLPGYNKSPGGRPHASDPPARRGRGRARRSAARFDAIQMMKLKRLADPQLSPDGKWVAYQADRRRPRRGHAQHRHLDRRPSDGAPAAPRRLTDHAAADTRPRWSPDGTPHRVRLRARRRRRRSTWSPPRAASPAR